MSVTDHFSVVCPHGYRNVDADECRECLMLEVAKQQVIHSVEHLLAQYVDPDDNTTRALVLTAAGHYVSMKLNRPEQSAKILHAIDQVLQHTLPAPPDERLIAQQHFLTELSFEAHDPEEIECLYSPTLARRLFRLLPERIRRSFKRTSTPHNSKLLLQSKR
jgi:hypothetical protein